MGEAKLECPFCERPVGGRHEKDCPRYGPNRRWGLFERVTMPKKRRSDLRQIEILVKVLTSL